MTKKPHLSHWSPLAAQTWSSGSFYLRAAFTTSLLKDVCVFLDPVQGLAHSVSMHTLSAPEHTERPTIWGTVKASWFPSLALELCKRLQMQSSSKPCSQDPPPRGTAVQERLSPQMHPGALGHSLFLSCSSGFHVWCVYFLILLFCSHFPVNCFPVSEVWLEAGAYLLPL